MADSVFLGGPFLHQASVMLTDAQIKALPTVPIQIIAAPGVGLAIVPAFWTWQGNFTASYTNVNANYLVQDSPLGALAYYDEATQGLFAGTTGDFLLLGGSYTTAVGEMAFVGAGSFYKNTAITIAGNNAAGGNLTGGNAANTLAITVSYYVLNTANGQFV